MNKEEFIEKAYQSFSDFKKPKQCTIYTDFEDDEFNKLLLSATNRSLSIEQVGILTWSPISCMNPEALVYFMPRLIELAVINAIDRDGDLFFCHFINVFYEGPNNERFKLFGPEQNKIMAYTFKFLYQTYHERLELEGWLEEAQKAEKNWTNT